MEVEDLENLHEVIFVVPTWDGIAPPNARHFFSLL